MHYKLLGCLEQTLLGVFAVEKEVKKWKVE
jgi:hypothetical protein